MAIDLEFCIDESKNKFRLLKEIARGGQGVVYKTQYPNIVLKIELAGEQKSPVPANDVTRRKFLAVRTLPIPRNVNVTLPLSILEEFSGYTMQMMDDMISFKEAFAGTFDKNALKNPWLESFVDSDPEAATIFANLIDHGGLRRFFRAYLYAAKMLAQIHGAGLVYCDFSWNNIFISKDLNFCNVWLIDSDNLDYQKNTRQHVFFTPHIGAPELHGGRGGCTFYSDEFAFASTLFQQLVMCPLASLQKLEGHHPFDGLLFDEMLEQCGDLEEVENYRDCGGFPWVFDSEDDSNFWEGGELFLEFIPPAILNLLDKTFGKNKGLFYLGQRPSMNEWSFELAKTVDEIIRCPNCQMDRFGNAEKCSWCDNEHSVVTMRSQFNSGAELWKFSRELSEEEIVEVPMRIVHGYRTAEIDEPAFKIVRKVNGVEIKNVSEKFFAEFETDTVTRTRAANFETSEKKFFVHCTDTQNFKSTIEVKILNATE